MVTVPLVDMRENSSWKMQGFHDLQWTGARRPQTAVWRIPKKDARREKYSKSAREPVRSYEVQSPVSSSSVDSSLDSDVSSQVIDLRMSNGAQHGCCKDGNFPNSTDRKLPHIHGSADQTRSNVSEGSSLSLNLIGHQSSHTCLTSIELKMPWYMTVLHEKEQCLLRLGEEINRLSRFEVESKRKDLIISTLRNEISQLQSDLQQTGLLPTKREEVTLPDSESSSLAREPMDRTNLPIKNTFPEPEEYFPVRDLRQEILESSSSPRGLLTASERNVSTISLAGSFSEIQQESHNPQMEAEQRLHDEDDDGDDGDDDEDDDDDDDDEDDDDEDEDDTPAAHEIIGDPPSDQTASAGFVDESRGKNEIIQKLQDEIKDIKKDYEMSKGVISSLQRAVFSHESKMRKSEWERESLQTELAERAIQLQAMSKKFSNLREGRKHEELTAAIEKENYDLRELLSELKSEMRKRNDVIADMRSDVQRLQREILGYRTQLRRQEGEWNRAESRAKELAASGQHVRVAMEMLRSRFERFRGKILQAVYTAPGCKAPQTEISDNDLLQTMQKIITERSEFHQQLKQKGVKIPPLHLSEGPAAAKQTPSAMRKKAP